MGSLGGGEGGGCTRRSVWGYVYPHSGWESGPMEPYPYRATASGGLPHTVPQGPATARTGLAGSRLHTSCGRRGRIRSQGQEGCGAPTRPVPQFTPRAGSPAAQRAPAESPALLF